MQKMAVLMKTVFPKHSTVGGPGPGKVLGNAGTTGSRIIDHGTWTAKCMLVMLKGRTVSLRAEMGGQKHAYINMGRGQLFLNNLW